MKKIYFDNAATTCVSKNVAKAIYNCLQHNYGNPSSSHSFGRSSKVLIEQTRKNIAKQLKVTPSEIIFTSGGTEADNFVLNAVVRDLKVTQIITSMIEHHAVLHTIDALKNTFNIKVEYVKTTPDGSIDYTHLETLLQKNTNKTLVSLMHVNNEIGTLLDIKHVGDLCAKNNALFHSDMVQSIGHYNIDLSTINIDFCAVSAHKFHGPKGVGFAFIKKNTGLNSLIFGGDQERGLRAGTESVHNIVGLDVAFKEAYTNLEKNYTYIKNLKCYFIEQITKEIPAIQFNGLSNDFQKSTYTLVNFSLPVTPEKALTVLFTLDLNGIACSQGSACQSGSHKKSHVLSEILTFKDLKKPALRFSFSKYNTKEEVDYAISVLKKLTL